MAPGKKESHCMQICGHTIQNLCGMLGVLVGVLSHVGVVTAHHTPEHQGNQAATPLVVGGFLGTAAVSTVIAATASPKARWHRQFQRTNRDCARTGLPLLDYCTTLRTQNAKWAAHASQCR